MTKPQRARSWAFLAYLAADNDLAKEGRANVREIAEGAHADTHVALEIDTGNPEGSIRLELDCPDGGKHGRWTTLQKWPDRDSGDPRVLGQFLAWGMGRFDATSYAVVISGHGNGLRGVAEDWRSRSAIDIPSLQRTLRQARGAGAKRDAAKIAVLGFDACRMAMLEIAHQMRSEADVLVASQKTELADGWPYDRVLREVRPQVTGRQLGRKIVEVFIERHRARQQDEVTLAAVDLRRIEATMRATSRLGRSLEDALGNGLSRAAIRECCIRTQAFTPHEIDLADLAGLIARDVGGPPGKAAAKVVRRVADCVIHAESYGDTVDRAHGLSIWFPREHTELRRRREQYAALNFARRAEFRGWLDFLDRFHA